MCSYGCKSRITQWIQALTLRLVLKHFPHFLSLCMKIRAVLTRGCISPCTPLQPRVIGRIEKELNSNNLHFVLWKHTDYKCCILAVPLDIQLHALKNVVFPLRPSLRVLAAEPLCLSDSASCQQTGGIYYPTCWQRIADSRTAVWDCIVRTFFFFYVWKFLQLKVIFHCQMSLVWAANCWWSSDSSTSSIHIRLSFAKFGSSCLILWNTSSKTACVPWQIVIYITW